MVNQPVKVSWNNTYDTYHLHVINDDSIDVRTTVLISNLIRVMYDVWIEPKLFYSLHNTSCVSQGINEEDSALVERLHLRECHFKVALADLRSNGEEELAASGHLALNPHIPLHQGYETLRNR